MTLSGATECAKSFSDEIKKAMKEEWSQQVRAQFQISMDSLADGYRFFCAESMVKE